MIEKLLKYKEKYQNILKSKSHAIILESEDERFLKDFSYIFALNLLCQNKMCLKCSNCKKILDNNCLDVIRFDKNIMVEDVEQIVETVNVVPAENEYKIYVISNFDSASERVQNKLLKTLEEPPKFVKFLLLTKNCGALLPTVLSRCEKYSLPKFENLELLYLLEGGEAYSLPIIENCDGMYGLALSYSQNKDYLKTYELCFDMLKNMLNSSKMLQFSSKIIENKDNLMLFVKLLLNALNDIMQYNLGCEDLIKNKSKINDIQLLSSSYPANACTQIILMLNKIKQKLMFNANVNLVVDKMLLSILEVKHKCKK